VPRFIGVMSGTSMDAVDAVLVEFNGQAPRLEATYRTPWPPALRERLAALACGMGIDAAGLAALDVEVGEFVAHAVTELLVRHGSDPAQITAIGCHGQTVAHAPDAKPAATLQLGDANVIAERTGITTVNDFRRRDLAAGGQGAPLAPAFHAAVLRDPFEDRIVLNLGGIANITVLPADPAGPVSGFDTGPANCLMDAWARQHLGAPYDAGGEWAATALPDPRLLKAMHDDPFFRQAPPKSTGTQYFSLDWLRGRLALIDGPSPAEVQASLLELTCQTVVEAVGHAAPDAARILVCGGGVHNLHLMRRLNELSSAPVESTARLGMDPDWVEAMAFAWLAHRALTNAPGNLPSVTGARGPRILGAIHRA
jgi:anhydro-N-acetylmuramic acid kinase